MGLRAVVVALSLIVALAGVARGEDGFPAAFQARLAAADVAGAVDLARSRLATDPADAQARFALGAAQFLGAVEGLGRDFWRHGLTQAQGENFLTGGNTPFGVTMLPFLRLPVPSNPAPQPFTAEVFHQILADFDSQVAQSAATLAAAPRNTFRLPLDINAIRLDLNGDGIPQDDEKLTTILSRVAYLDDSVPLSPITFDEGDLPWLEGYTHLLQGITGILLAHDLTDTVNQTFAMAFPASTDLPSAPLVNAMGAGGERLRAMQDEGKCDYDRIEPLLYGDADLTDTEQQAINDYETCAALASAARIAGIGDVVAFIHLMHWQVIEPERLKASRQHFLKMIALSRESWALILAETDNDREWLPNPRQTGPFPELRVTDEILAGWMDFLDQAEAVLEGRLLIPHWRWDDSHGLNIARMFDDPQPLDPVLLIAGVGAIPYIEEGPLAPGSTMNTAMQMMEGGPLAYFLWFN